MKLICAGLPKTGTKSVASALRILGYNAYDIEDHWRYHLDEYVDALEGKQIPDFATMYANVDAITDTPACYFWKEIFAVFPDAKVLLMVRDSEEVWVESLTKTVSIALSVNSSWWMRLRLLCTPTGRKWNRFFPSNRKKLGLNPNDIHDTTAADVYTKYNAQVKSSIPQDQLLVFNVKQGWKPLCEFLGVEVPDVPFPRLNVKSDLIGVILKNSHIQERMTKELCVILAVLVFIVAVLFYWQTFI